MRLFSDDRAAAIHGREACDEADLHGRAVHVPPRQPEAIGVPQRALAVMLLHVFGREHVLAVGHRVLGRPIGFVEGIHLQRAVNGHRLLLIAPIEPNLAAETAHRRRPGRVQDRRLPDGDELHRPGKLSVFSSAPRDALGQIERLAARSRQQREAH